MKTEPRLAAAAPARSTRTGTRRRELRFVAPLLVVTIAGVVLATAKYGIGLTPDSVVYVTGAHGLATGHGYTNSSGAITDFPPGYSAVLSAGEHVSIGALDGARIVSVLGFVATVLLGYALLRRHCRSSAVRIGATALLACSAVLLDVYEKALSEHLFIPMTLLFALLIEEEMARRRATSLLIALVGCVWAAFFLRYIGIVFAATGALVILVAGWRRHRAAALLRAALFAALSVSVPVVWMIRNVHSGSGAFGHRSSASATVFTNVSRALKPVASWLVTDAGPPALRALLLLVVIVFVGVLVLDAASSNIGRKIEWRPVVPLILLVVIYVVYLVASASVVAFGAISNTRFMVPVYVPMVVLGAWAFEQLRDRLDSAVLYRAFNVAAVAFVGINAIWFGARAIDSYRNGAGGYSTPRYHDSQLLADVRHLDRSIPAYSNDAPAITLFTHRTVQPSVARTYFHSDDQTGRIGDFVRSVSCRGHALLIWFVPNPRPYLYTPADLATRLSLHPLIERRDGTIYEMRPRVRTSVACR